MPRKKYLRHFQKKKGKFYLLFDAPFAKPSTFKKLSKKANIAHVYFTYQLSKQADDEYIYNLGSKENRFIVSTDNDFKKYVKKDKAGVIVLPSGLSNEQIDTVLCNFLRDKNPRDYHGKATKIK